MAQRHPELPDCPTCKEQRFNLVGGACRGVAVPRSTPADIQAQLAEILRKIDAGPDFIRKMGQGGFAMLGVGPAQMPISWPRCGRVTRRWPRTSASSANDDGPGPHRRSKPAEASGGRGRGRMPSIDHRLAALRR